MSATYRILFLGDVVGKPGRTAIKEGLPSLLDTYQPLFTVINGENLRLRFAEVLAANGASTVVPLKPAGL